MIICLSPSKTHRIPKNHDKPLSVMYNDIRGDDNDIQLADKQRLRGIGERSPDKFPQNTHTQINNFVKIISIIEYNIS